MQKLLLLGLVTLFGLLPMVLTAQEDAPDDNAQPGSDSVSVTVYNQGSALVQDRRTFMLNSGTNTLDFTDVAARIDPTSVSFVSISDPQGTIVLEQNYIYDLVNSSALLQRYLDETLVVTTEDDSVYEGRLLSGRDGTLILQDENGEVVVIQIDTVRDMRFPELPDGLITRPTLRWLIESVQDGEQQVELTYLTGGMSWTADYNVLLTTDNSTLDINGWVTLNNTSGTAYQDAQLKLVAGDVNRVPQPMTAMAGSGLEEMEAVAQDMSRVEQREFFEYQLYEVARPVTISDNETKQVEFVTGTAIPATTFFVYDGSLPFYGYGGPIVDEFYWETGVTDVLSYMEFSTGEENGLGADLPAGRIRVYQEDVDGAALLIGENRIDHTPQGETVSIYLGNAFDLVGERRQTNFEYVNNSTIRETFEIRLRNRKDSESVQIRVPERLSRWRDWEITDSSMDFTQMNAFSVEFRAEVPAGEEVVITYTVQYSLPSR